MPNHIIPRAPISSINIESDVKQATLEDRINQILKAALTKAVLPETKLNWSFFSTIVLLTGLSVFAWVLNHFKLK